MKIASAASETAELPILTDPLEARGHPPQLEALFRNTVEHAPVGIAFANPDGSFRHCNRAFCSMLGFSAKELRRRSIASLTVADDREATLAGHERLWRGDITHLDVERRYLRKDGGALWVRVTTSLVRGGGEEPVCTVEFLRDISARKQMAAALLQNQTLLATVIAELPLALLACDVTGQVTHYNRAAVELFGIPTEHATALPRSAYPVTSDVYQLDGTTPVPPRIVRWRVRCAVTPSSTPSSSSSHPPVRCARRFQARDGSSARPDRHSAPWRWSRTSPNGASPNRSSSTYTSSCWSRPGRRAWPKWRPTYCTTSATC